MQVSLSRHKIVFRFAPSPHHHHHNIWYCISLNPFKVVFGTRAVFKYCWNINYEKDLLVPGCLRGCVIAENGWLSLDRGVSLTCCWATLQCHTVSLWTILLCTTLWYIVVYCDVDYIVVHCDVDYIVVHCVVDWSTVNSIPAWFVLYLAWNCIVAYFALLHTCILCIVAFCLLEDMTFLHFTSWGHKTHFLLAVQSTV